MAKGHKGSQPDAWVPVGLKVRTAAPQSVQELVPNVIPDAGADATPSPTTLVKKDAVLLSVLDTKPLPQTESQKRRMSDHFPDAALPNSQMAENPEVQNSGAQNPEPQNPEPEAPFVQPLRDQASISEPKPNPTKPGFRPMPILSFFSLICLCALFALGQWQWDKYILKSQAPTQVATVEAISVAAALEAPHPEYRPVIVEGLIDPRTIKISVVQEGVRGYRLFSPVVMEAGGIFIDRGFVSEEDVLNVVAPSGQVSINGVLRTGAKANRYTPDNDPAADVWYWPDLMAMSDMLVIQTVGAQYYVAQSEVDPLATGKTTANPYADSKGTSQIEPGTHLGYALQWWGFGLALIGVYIGLHVRTGRLRFRAAPSS
jgi:surfeit locus 1 family protein